METERKERERKVGEEKERGVKEGEGEVKVQVEGMRRRRRRKGREGRTFSSKRRLCKYPKRHLKSSKELGYRRAIFPLFRHVLWITKVPSHTSDVSSSVLLL